MYLDTDIILALVKEEDWLKPHVHMLELTSAKTSVFAVIEARLVMEREYGRREALAVFSLLQKLPIKLLPFDENVLAKSQELMQQYPRLNIFDAVHVAFALLHDEVLLSTDTLFATISGLKRKDPRQLPEKN